jgi:hypothetical protein
MGVLAGGRAVHLWVGPGPARRRRGGTATVWAAAAVAGLRPARCCRRPGVTASRTIESQKESSAPRRAIDGGATPSSRPVAGWLRWRSQCPITEPTLVAAPQALAPQEGFAVPAAVFVVAWSGPDRLRRAPPSWSTVGAPCGSGLVVPVCLLIVEVVGAWQQAKGGDAWWAAGGRAGPGRSAFSPDRGSTRAAAAPAGRSPTTPVRAPHRPATGAARRAALTAGRSTATATCST